MFEWHSFFKRKIKPVSSVLLIVFVILWFKTMTHVWHMNPAADSRLLTPSALSVDVFTRNDLHIVFGSPGGSLLWLSAVWRRPRVKCLLQSLSGRGVEVEIAVLRSPMRWLFWRCPAATPGLWISSLHMRRIMISSWCWNSEFLGLVIYAFVLKCSMDRKKSVNECEEWDLVQL